MKMIKSKFGFSILEILIAVGIFATASISLFSVTINSAGKINENEQLIQGIILANNKMVELEQEIEGDIDRGKFPDETEKAGKFEDQFSDYSWDYAVKKVELPKNLLEGQEGVPVAVASELSKELNEISKSIRELSLTVSWGESGGENKNEKITLTTHLVEFK